MISSNYCRRRNPERFLCNHRSGMWRPIEARMNGDLMPPGTLTRAGNAKRSGMPVRRELRSRATLFRLTLNLAMSRLTPGSDHAEQCRLFEKGKCWRP
jgi:hypothetical protein